MSILFHHGILGLNARNLLYIRPFNPRKAIALADDKMRTKAFLATRGIPVAKIYARIASRKELRSFDCASLSETCVLKPNRGFGGEGILILKGRRGGMFLEQGKNPIPERRLREHIEDILDGRFSIDGRPDTAFFEKLLIPHECFAPFRPAGLPDIRIIVFNLIPVMAMLRIPTAQSGGKANVHLGGIGVGIDLANGTTTHAAQYNSSIPTLPHGRSVSGIPIPGWHNLLLIASRIQELTNIGYLAVDLTIDAEQGPLLLEVNARAGLMVQVANLAPLRRRLERIKGAHVRKPEQGVRIAQDLFGQKEHLPPQAEDGRIVIAPRETIIIPGNQTHLEIPCRISPEQEWTIFSPELLRGKGDMSKTQRVKFFLKGKKIHTIVHRGPMPNAAVRAVIGRRDLAGFLIDPFKEPPDIIRKTARKNMHRADRTIAQINRNLSILPLLQPQNLSEERAHCEQNRAWNPILRYPSLPEQIDIWEQQLRDFAYDDSPLGILLHKKQEELLARMRLLRTRGNAQAFTGASMELFGQATEELQRTAKTSLEQRAACDLPTPSHLLLSAETAQRLLQEALSAYGLHEWSVRRRLHMIADCAVGGKILYIRHGARFAPDHIATLIAHEIETHALTTENGEHQPFQIFRSGCANYSETQEGLAIFNQNRILSPYHEKRFSAPRTTLAVAFALGHSFADTRQYLEEELGYSPEKALTKTLQLKRGLGNTAEPGAFTKGLVYFRGLQSIEQFVAQGGDLRKLYIGKIALEDLSLLAQIPDLVEPVLLPTYLSSHRTLSKDGSTVIQV
ncbi:DUF1704 domain-containing protein [Candidatus Peregrinibacteria bacterium]|nr:DUF1704 domain-containing protein [Candidatus Peregrinibacteria bacterium]